MTEAEILEWMGDIQHILALIGTRLEKRNSPYQVLFSALLSLIESNVDITELRRSVAEEERDDTPAALDKIWEEEMVTFGAAKSDACGGQQPTREVSVAVETIKSSRRQS